MTSKERRKAYSDGILGKLISEHLTTPVIMNSVADDHVQPGDKSPDFVMEYSILLLKYYFLVADIKDAVRDGNGKRINHLHKQLFHHFKTDSGYNAYSIEMFISIIQNEVLLSVYLGSNCKLDWR